MTYVNNRIDLGERVCLTSDMKSTVRAPHRRESKAGFPLFVKAALTKVVLLR